MLLPSDIFLLLLFHASSCHPEIFNSEFEFPAHAVVLSPLIAPPADADSGKRLNSGSIRRSGGFNVLCSGRDRGHSLGLDFKV